MSEISVLLVDDEEDYARTLAERLEMRDVGSRVAASGEEALRMVAEEVPDVMVLDLRMPGLDGKEVLKRVRKTYPSMEVIVVTGHGSETDESEARRLGAFAYLRKPFDINHLVDTVWRAGDPSRAERS